MSKGQINEPKQPCTRCGLITWERDALCKDCRSTMPKAAQALWRKQRFGMPSEYEGSANE